MTKPTHIIRFMAKEDSHVHLGQPLDTNRDVGLGSIEEMEIKAYLMNGSVFNEDVTETVLTVHHLVLSRPSPWYQRASRPI